MLVQVMGIIAAKNIQPSLNEYGIDDYGPLLQEWLNDEHGPGAFKIVCYGENDFIRPIWSSNADDTAKPLIMFYSDNKKEFYYDRKLAKDISKTL